MPPKKKIDYTQEFINVTKKFYKVTAKSNQVLDNIKETIKEINHRNILHSQETTTSFANQGNEITDMKVCLKDYQDFIVKQIIGVFIKVFWVVIVAIIILAGARQAVTLFNL